jgi:hypothetical protein
VKLKDEKIFEGANTYILIYINPIAVYGALLVLVALLLKSKFY